MLYQRLLLQMVRRFWVETLCCLMGSEVGLPEPSVTSAMMYLAQRAVKQVAHEQ